jgi:pimeloyl-ACP methyl ester carboxylesterase
LNAVVVYVHGLWLKGREAAWLRRRVSQELAAETRAFSYPSVTANVAANVHALARYLEGISTDTLHLVGHSLGGLVILKLFETGTLRDGLFESGSPMPPGRIVLLGSPVRGCRAAQRLAQLPFGKKIMGLTVDDELLTPRSRRWDTARDLGLIAGDVGIGLGRLVGRFAEPNDGTVAVEETRLEGATDHRVLRVSHSGMLFSAAVAKQTAAFLRSGRFER